MPKRSLIDQLDQAITAMFGQPEGAVPGVGPEIAPLMQIAAELRKLPRENFKQELEMQLQGGTVMETMTAPVKAVRTVAMPRLTFKDAARAIEFYVNAFGAKETMRFVDEGKVPHAEVLIGDSSIMITEEWPEGGRFSAETLGSSPVMMQVSVPNVDEFVERAVAAGAKVARPVADQFYGRREGTLVDPFGYHWGVSTLIEDLSVEEMHRRLAAFKAGLPKPMVSPVPAGYHTVTPYIVAQDAEVVVDFIKKTFDGEEFFRTVTPAGGYHVELKVGDSMFMIGGGGPKLAWRGDAVQGAFHIYVPNCDATYERALQAGGTSVDPPEDHFYGERSATVKDAVGDVWYIATHKGGGYKPKDALDVQPFLHPLRAEPVIGFLKRAFGAEELSRHASSDGVVHYASLKVGSSYIEMGEAHGPYQPMPGMFYLYVPDCDALYHRALAAGATSISEPQDHPYGDRSGGVKDVFGNQWYVATHIKDFPKEKEK